jgi:hypothetical protein
MVSFESVFNMTNSSAVEAIGAGLSNAWGNICNIFQQEKMESSSPSYDIFHNNTAITIDGGDEDVAKGT